MREATALMKPAEDVLQMWPVSKRENGSERTRRLPPARIKLCGPMPSWRKPTPLTAAGFP
jgi:hypothetical protein